VEYRPQVAGGFQDVQHGLRINQLCATFEEEEGGACKVGFLMYVPVLKTQGHEAMRYHAGGMGRIRSRPSTNQKRAALED